MLALMSVMMHQPKYTLAESTVLDIGEFEVEFVQKAGQLAMSHACTAFCLQIASRQMEYCTAIKQDFSLTV